MRALLISSTGRGGKKLIRSVTALKAACLRPSSRRNAAANSDITCLFRKRSGRVGKSLKHEYSLGYKAAKSITGSRSATNITIALRVTLPAARTEFQWGIIDALTDAAIGGAEFFDVTWPEIAGGSPCRQARR